MSQVKTGSAPGQPGSNPFWKSGRKSGIGRAANFRSRVWFTTAEGILNEIYFPRPDLPSIKDCGLIITDGHSFFSEERADTTSEVTWASPGAPALRIVNTHRGQRYRILKEIVADPEGDVVLQRIRFEAWQGSPSDYRIYVLLASHLGDGGRRNSGAVSDFKGDQILFASSKQVALALVCSSGWRTRSVGFVGVSDGWQDLSQHRRLLWQYDRAEEGNVALTGELGLDASGESVVAIGFGQTQGEAAYEARASVRKNFQQVWDLYVAEWEAWQNSLVVPASESAVPAFRQSAAVLRTHEAAQYPGARVASLSVPWGQMKDRENTAGYHAVWARDCSQSAMGLFAAGAIPDALGSLTYLRRTQEAGGDWPQIMWIDGEASSDGIQTDSVAAPVILYEIIRQNGGETHSGYAAQHWPLVSSAAKFICRQGPITEEDRWERNGGFSVYTLSLTIAALVIAAQAAREHGDQNLADYFIETADAWNGQIETWTYGPSDFARSLNLPGCYYRIIPPDQRGRPAFEQVIELGDSELRSSAPACEMVSPDVWALVRYGLRPAHDERVRQTTQAIDATLKNETSNGPVWGRYQYDGYGETQKGKPFSGQGQGRGWPLLTGERAHYELACGNLDEARHLLETMERFSEDVGLIPEQIWNAGDLPEMGLFNGRATGSARPLAWAHAEYLQLRRSLLDQRVFTCPRVVEERYVHQSNRPRHTVWRPDLQVTALRRGTILRIETRNPVEVTWYPDSQKTTLCTSLSPVGGQYLDLPTESWMEGTICFELQGWESGSTSFHEVQVEGA